MANAGLLADIERRVGQLSREDQLWLIECLAHSLRNASRSTLPTVGHDLAAMAADPEIQKELREIAAEFRDRAVPASPGSAHRQDLAMSRALANIGGGEVVSPP